MTKAARADFKLWHSFWSNNVIFKTRRRNTLPWNIKNGFMKKTFYSALLSVSALLAAGSAQAQNRDLSIGDVLNGVLGSGKNNTGTNNTNTGTQQGSSNTGSGISLNSLSNADIANGLKEALNIGAKNASARLSAKNGYFGNPLVKILMPPEAVKVENTLRGLGMGKVVDNAILSMNRAAEDAAVKAAPIFINAITSMSIQDGINILTGGNGAATNYLKQKTTDALTQAFKPVISSSLSKVGATALWSNVFNIYNKLPTTYSKINPDLTGYVTERALTGLFTNIADEENKIRSNPAARVSGLLQKVFGAK